MGKNNRPEPESLELPCVGVDSHAHLDLEDFDEDREELIARATASGISQIVNVFMGPDALEKNRSMFDNHPQISFLMGVHPCDALTLTDETLDHMRDLFKSEPRLKGMGEIGLDFYWDDAPPKAQKEALVRQLHLARELSQPVVIHSRDANEDTVKILEAEGFKDYPLLWHCFGGGLDFAKVVMDNGWYVSIPGPVTFRKKSDDVQAAVARIPFERMLIETDSPYLTPEPWRGKRNHPALVVFTAQRIAQIKGRPIEDLWRITGDNARAFFNL